MKIHRVRHLRPWLCPRPLVHQWVLFVPKRLCFLLQREGVVLHMVLRIFCG